MDNKFDKTIELIKELERAVLEKAELVIQNDRIWTSYRKQILDLFGQTYAIKRLKSIYNNNDNIT